MLTRSRPYPLFVALLLTVALFAKCKDLEKNLPRLVRIEYQQSLNFEEYEFADTFLVPDPSTGTSQEWQKMRINDRTERETRKGVWMVFQVCSIWNEGSKAKPFDYDVARFFVEYKGRRFHAGPLKPNTVQSIYPVQGFQAVAQSTTDAISAQFRSETQLGPDHDTISPSPHPFVDDRRFVIYVNTNIGDLTDLTKLDLPLQYDRTAVVLTDNSGTTTKAFTGTVRKGNLPTHCRSYSK